MHILSSRFIKTTVLLTLLTASACKPLKETFTISSHKKTQYLAKKALKDSTSYELLRELCAISTPTPDYPFGGRMPGSPQAYKAEERVAKKLEQYCDTVFKQEVPNCPHFIPGKDTATLHVDGNDIALQIVGLGRTIPTDGPITAPVIVIDTHEDIEKRGKKGLLKDKIVVLNFSMTDFPSDQTLQQYYKIRGYRHHGSNFVAPYGAAAVLTRSCSSQEEGTPHAGQMGYDADKPQIPAGSIATQHASTVAQALANYAIVKALSDSAATMTLNIESRMGQSSTQHNIIGEIKGVHSDTIITVGGHLDARHLGEGAQDDGVGVTLGMSLMNFLKQHNIKPRYTIRFVAFADEEIGFNGALQYGKKVEEEIKNGKTHYAAMEGDLGAIQTTGFEIQGPLATPFKEKYQSVMTEFNMINKGVGGASDIGVMPPTTTKFGLISDAYQYFKVHHGKDKFTSIEKEDLQKAFQQYVVLLFLLLSFQN